MAVFQTNWGICPRQPSIQAGVDVVRLDSTVVLLRRDSHVFVGGPDVQRALWIQGPSSRHLQSGARYHLHYTDPLVGSGKL